MAVSSFRFRAMVVIFEVQMASDTVHSASRASTTRGTVEAGPAWLLASAFAAVYLVWGSTYFAIRVAVESIPPFLMAG